jgi:hypothetical protein
VRVEHGRERGGGAVEARASADRVFRPADILGFLWLCLTELVLLRGSSIVADFLL